MNRKNFTQTILSWYDQGHRDLPWRRTQDPYRIWISEIMLQQTRAETVVSYYERFLARYPTVQDLASAPEEELLKAWEGLGYYSRARSLQKAAKEIVARYGGQLPADLEKLRALPGIGDYTAGAIASIAFGIPAAAVDGNVERVLCRWDAITDEVGTPAVRRQIAARAQALDGGLHEDFRVGTRHEGVRRDLEGEPHEFFFPDDVGDGDALDALLDGLAVARELRWLERLVEVDVEVDAFAAEDVAEEDFGVEARRLDAFFLEILFGPFEDAADGPEFLHVSPPASAAAPGPR